MSAQRNRAMNNKLSEPRGNTTMNAVPFATGVPIMTPVNGQRVKRRRQRTRGQLRLLRLPRADSTQTVLSRAVTSIAHDSSGNTYWLAKGLATGDAGTSFGFLNWDGHLNAMSNAFRFFRVVQLTIEATLAAGPNTGANLAIGYQMGPLEPGSQGNLLDNEHALFIPAAQGYGKVVVPRSGLLRSNEWYQCSTQSLSTTVIGATTIHTIIPGNDEAAQGCVVAYPGAGTVESGDIAWVTFTSIVEFKEPL